MTKVDLKELRNQRGTIITAARKLVDLAEGEKRDFTAEEKQSYGKMLDEVETLRGRIEREERQAELDRESALRAAPTEPAPGNTTPEQRVAALQMEGFRAAMRSRQLDGASAEALKAFRDLQVGVDTQAGYLMPPLQFVADLIKAKDNLTFMRGLATKYTITGADGLGVPSLDADPDDFDWTTELKTGTADSSMAFGRRELRPHPFAKRIKLSKTLVRKLPAVENIVRDRLAYKAAVTEEKAFLTGTGLQRPLGVFVASADGIPTSRDVATGNTATEIRFDGLIEAKYSLKVGYWPNAQWLFHRDAIKQLIKLKNANGDYIWREGVRSGEPDRLLDRPVNMSEYAPNTFTTGLYVGMFADFSYYWIVDALNLQIQALLELYAETNQDGFILRQEADGMPVLAEAFARVKLG